MATVNNRIGGTAVAKKQANNAIVNYMANGVEIKLSPQIVKKFLISGDPSNVTDEEIMMFMSLCKYQGLNPFIHEAYCIKYGNQPATQVVGKEAFLKRAEQNEQYNGMDSGIVVQTDEGIVYRNGAIATEDETIIGGWAEVHRKDRDHPTHVEVSFAEYAGRKKDGALNGQWSTKPATMIRKVAQVQALREAFPTNLGGMYAAEEQGVEEPAMAAVPQEVVEADVKEVQQPAPNPADALFGEQEEF